MNKMKIVEIIVKIIIIVVLLKFVARWPYDKIVYIMASLLVTIYIIWPLLIKFAKSLRDALKKLL